MNHDEQFMRLAIIEAKKAKDEDDLPFGAIVVRNGEVVGRGRSRELTEKDSTAHAETHAISEACHALQKKDLSDCEMYATGEPCNMCSAAVFHAHIQQIIISVSRDDLPSVFRPRNIRIEELAKDSSYQPKIVKGVLREEMMQLFSDIKLR